ncbi:MAG: GNAT family N-acetyltransferase [Candidatus Helarchaeota archaeon]|nr:GNAT family N-acetyltransferase [Candidatus Helarchaeota archaeon]
MAKIRIMTEKDIDVAKKLMKALVNEMDERFDEDRWNESINTRLSDDEIFGIYFTLIAEESNAGEKGKICGIAFSEVREEIPGSVIYGYISNVYVIPEKRNNGIGTQLLKESIKSLKRSNVSKIRLNIKSNMESGLKIVKKIGFKEISKTMEIN